MSEMAEANNMSEAKEEKITKSESFVSVVAVLGADTRETVEKVPETVSYLRERYSDFEIVLVAKKSAESEAERLVQLTDDGPNDVAREAGLENAIGDFVVLTEPKYDPVDLIGKAVTMCREGTDVIVGVSALQHSIAYNLLRPVSQLLLRLADYRLPRNASHFRCLSRRAANAVTQSGKAHQLFYMRIQKSGYGFKTLEYKSLCSEGRGFWHALRKLVKLLVFNSQAPLHLISGLSFGASLVAFLFAVYAVGIKLFLYGVVDGWTSTFLAISLFAMLQFLILGFIGEYLARMLDEQSRQSSYSTVFEKNSLTMVDADRINGYTGFVGSNLMAAHEFGAKFNSKNIADIEGQSFNLLVCAGAPAKKWYANLHPEEDRDTLDGLMSHLSKVRAERVVLISTVDVFRNPFLADENTGVDMDGLNAYGLNRRRLELFVKEHFENVLIVRLPGLVGKGLKKNILFDFHNDNQVEKIDSRGVFQFYPVSRLWDDIGKAEENGLSLVHLTSAPVSVEEVAREVWGREFRNEVLPSPAKYDFRSAHAGLWGRELYQVSRDEEIAAIREWNRTEPVRSVG